MQDYGKTAVNTLARDLKTIASLIEGKDPSELNFAAIKEAINLVGVEAEKVENGIYANDNSPFYTADEEISFSK